MHFSFLFSLDTKAVYNLRLIPAILCHSMSRTFCSHVAMLQTSVAACRFQNEYNNMEIALRVVQFCSGLKLVITNRTTALLSCDFVITCLISDQIALHSVQLPLLINRL